MSSVLILAFAAFSYLTFIGSSFWMVAFLPGFDTNPSSRLLSDWQIAAAVDLGLVALFGIVHSVLARPSVKRVWTQIIPPAAERAFFLLQSSCLLALIFWKWRPIPTDIWRVEGLAAVPILSVFTLGVVVIVLATFLLDHFAFTGLRQAWSNFRCAPMQNPEFRTPLLYKHVRHPMQSGILITLFAVPHMTVDGLLFAGAMTTYILVRLRFEECALLRDIGAAYDRYRAEVPMLIPRILRRNRMAN